MNSSTTQNRLTTMLGWHRLFALYDLAQDTQREGFRRDGCWADLAPMGQVQWPPRLSSGGFWRPSEPLGRPAGNGHMKLVSTGRFSSYERPQVICCFFILLKKERREGRKLKPKRNGGEVENAGFEPKIAVHFLYFYTLLVVSKRYKVSSSNASGHEGLGRRSWEWTGKLLQSNALKKILT